jgi:hypothetical protein
VVGCPRRRAPGGRLLANMRRRRRHGTDGAAARSPTGPGRRPACRRQGRQGCTRRRSQGRCGAGCGRSCVGRGGARRSRKESCSYKGTCVDSRLTGVENGRGCRTHQGHEATTKTAASGPVSAVTETADSAHIMKVRNGMKNQQKHPGTGSRNADAAHIRSVREAGKGDAVDYLAEALGEAEAGAGKVMTQAPSRKTRSFTSAARTSLLATFLPPALTVTASTGTVAF